MYGLNKRRKRRGRRRGRRSYRRNPARAMTGQLTAIAPKVGWGVVGALGTEAVPAIASRFLPLPTGRGAVLAVKGISGLTTAWIVRRFVGRAQGNAALVGALLPLILQPVRDFVLPFVTGIGAAPAMPAGGYLTTDGYLVQEGYGYLGPGTTVGQFDDEDVEEVPSRLEPGERF